jgi:formate hydrogenlyase subunit 4
MVDEARTLEHSGAPFALIKWGSALKQLVLYTIFINVFVAPWGLASSGKATDVVAAVFSLLGKALLLGVVFAVIDNSFSKLRLFKVTEFLAAAFLLACLGVVVFYLGGA